VVTAAVSRIAMYGSNHLIAVGSRLQSDVVQVVDVRSNHDTFLCAQCHVKREERESRTCQVVSEWGAATVLYLRSQFPQTQPSLFLQQQTLRQSDYANNTTQHNNHKHTTYI
jgi:hypothetical protein